MKKKTFYGWYIVVAAIFLTAISGGIVSTLAAYFPALVKTYGFSQTQVSSIAMFITLGGFVGTMIFGKAAGKANLRVMMLVGGLVEGVAVLAMGAVQNITLFFVCATIAGIAMIITSTLTVPILMTRWFQVKKGTALGIAAAGIGFGSAIFAPISIQIIAAVGVQAAFYCLGGFFMVVALLCALVVRSKPEDKGLKAYGLNEGDPAMTENTTTAAAGEPTGLTFPQAAKTASFWFLVLFSFSATLTAIAPVLQTPSYLGKLGWTAGTISLFLMASGICSMLGKVAVGALLDKLGLLKGGIIATIAAALCTGSMVLAGSVPILTILYVLFLGGGTMMFYIATPMLVSKLFGTKHYSSVYSGLSLISMPASLLVSIGSGAIVDKAGYPTVYLICALATIVTVFALTMALKLNKFGAKPAAAKE